MGLTEHFAAAALYAAFVAISLALAHRKILRLTWRAGLVLALLPLCFTGSALLTGKVYAPIDLAYGADPFAPFAAKYGVGNDHKGIFTDVYSAIIPWREAVRYAVSQGEWPLWNPFILCGDPLAGTAQPAPYHPINALSLLLPVALIFTFCASAQLFVSALVAFLYFRDLGCREVAAILGAVGWAFCSFLAFWLEWPLGATVALAPLAALGARRVVRQPGWPSALLLTAAVVLTIFAGHPESVVHVVVVGGVLGLAELVSVPRRQWGAVIGWTAVAAALTLALSAIYLLPLFESLQQTIQWLYRKSSTIAIAAAPKDAWRSLIAGAAPSIIEYPRPEGVPPLVPPLLSGYAGSVLWGPALYGLFRGRWKGRYVLAVLGLIGLCAGAKMPLIYTLLGRLPLLSMSINDRLVFAGAFATAALAALGIEAWLKAGEEGEPARASRELAVACAVAALAGAGIMAWLTPLGVDAGFPDAGLERWASWGLIPLFAVALITGLVAMPRLSRRALGWGAAALVVVLAVQRTGEMGSFYPTVPKRAFYPRVPPLQALPRNEGKSDEIPWRFVGQDYQMIPNQGTHYGIEDVRGYQAVFHHRFADLLPLWSNHLPSWFLLVSDVDRPFLSLVNVRYAMTRKERVLPGWKPLARSRTSQIWENPRALPRAFVPRRVRFGVPPDQEVEEMKAETDFGRLAWIVPPEGDPGPLRERRNGRGRVVTRRRGLGFELTARMNQAGWVVITETAWKGWRARIDGREVPLGTGDHAFLALFLPKGQHRVELFYRPRSFEVGLALSTAALALIAAVSLIRIVRRKRDAGSSAGAEPEDRRTGDRIAIAGDYQHRALHRGPAPQRFWHRAKLEEALALLRLAPGDRMLDAGCGSGLLASMAAEAPGVEVLGVDANPAAIEFASSTWTRPNLAFRRGLVDELDAAPESFEKIAFLEVIEHLSRAQGEAVLAQFARLLTPNGRLVLTTPNRRSPWPLIEWLLDRLHLVPQLSGEQHEVLYALDELRAMGESAGLVLAEHRMIDTVAPWLAWWPALARAVHRAEVRIIRRHGCVMVLAFEKRPA